MVQLTTPTKRKVIELIKCCLLDMNKLITKTTLNALPLGSYQVLIGMDWLESHKEVINCLDKTLPMWMTKVENVRSKEY